MTRFEPSTRLGKKIAALDDARRERDAAAREAAGLGPNPSELDLPPWMFVVIVVACAAPIALVGIVAAAVGPPVWLMAVAWLAAASISIVGLRSLAARFGRPRA